MVRGLFIMGAVALCLGVGAAEFPAIYNTEKETIPFWSAEQALASVKAPDGFKVTMFASEPMVQQPIDIKTDARGRVWVCENYTYSERAKNFDTMLRDRILILEDSDGDGKADKRTVFWDEGVRVTSVFPGFGGAFVLAPPQLLFVPDRDGNDSPDSSPEVLLDGFDASAVRHNIANGLKLGPDGWLYGRHGILATSKVGKPGAPENERTAFNAAIWRFHPVSKKFEVVCEGTTNPWGNDWDENGQHFFINTVIGHLWHVIPGAYYKRMYGEHSNPYLYELIDQTADHVHWDTREKWSDIRELGVTATTSELGGGHAHSGFMFYLGDNWPAKYHNTALTINYHGKRLNNDRIERAGATYTARHLPDPVQFGDPWFRGIELTTGPDGGVYVADWSDIGECHDETGIHRTSGRIYKISYGETKKWDNDLRDRSTEDLVALQNNSNDWLVRQSRQILQERSVSKDLIEGGVTNALRKVLALQVIGGLDAKYLNHPDEQVRAQTVQNLNEHRPEILALAKKENSGLVLTALASKMRNAEDDTRFALARALVTHGEFANDRVFPLMVWYGIQPSILDNVSRAVELADISELPKIRRFIARRFFQEIASNRKPADEITKLLVADRPSEFQIDLLTGMREGLNGVRRADAPSNWKPESLLNSPNEQVRFLALSVDSIFGNASSIDALKKSSRRQEAIETLVQIRAENLSPLLITLMADPKLTDLAIRSLSTLGDPKTPELLLVRYNELPQNARIEAMNTLAARPAYAASLLEAVQRGAIKRQEINAAQLRQLRGYSELKSKVAAIWPQLDESPTGKKKLFEKYKTLLTPERLKLANGSNGRAIFKQACATCHVLYGEGAKIGPELTGSDRANLDYLLDNIVDPSGVVPESYRVTNLNLKDDRALTGIVLGETDRTLTFQTLSEKITLQKSEVETRQASQLSMMPEGLLATLTDAQTLDLFAYLMSTTSPEN